MNYTCNTTSNTSESLEEEVFRPSVPKPFRKVLAQSLEFYVSGPIKEPEDYVGWFDLIRNAGPNDQIYLYINSGGGNVDTALQFMRVLSETEAYVTASIEGSCCSAATMIFLCADAFEITPHSLFMVHNYSGGIVGKGGEIYDQALFERSWSEEFLKSIYKDFLTEEEVQKLLDNKDLWLSSEAVSKRCQTLVSKRKTRHAPIDDESGL